LYLALNIIVMKDDALKPGIAISRRTLVCFGAAILAMMGLICYLLAKPVGLAAPKIDAHIDADRAIDSVQKMSQHTSSRSTQSHASNLANERISRRAAPALRQRGQKIPADGNQAALKLAERMSRMPWMQPNPKRLPYCSYINTHTFDCAV
jgi:hypothetical protein